MIAQVYDCKGGLIEIEVDDLNHILYKLRPRLSGETPAERVKAVITAKEAIYDWLTTQDAP